MRKLIILMLAGFLFACNNNPQVKEQQQVEQPSYDTNRALGPINFDISPQEYPAKVPGTYMQVGSYRYELQPGFSKAGKLTVLRLRSLSESADRVQSKLFNQMQNLLSVLKTENGAPTEDAGFPDFKTMKNGSTAWNYTWENQPKTIHLGLERIASDEYRVICAIEKK
ncbi:hypothetical protein FW774_05060 (plasmid) [Pedobacter sp. BS3]|uniref:hypothetical protein n=1 Tax=Pedobacter sp. BS3 TaxID=2567937 RepID=UPI0011EE0B8B|nr:hypothetical protein [Pedobacter sp. BS3]TZF86417.1 hypothetical protein FW774_05060 [Pedobacter sp. BS3]